MIRVYRYGSLAPTVNANLVRDQMHAAHRYRNQLVEIERGRRLAIRSLIPAGTDDDKRAWLKSHKSEVAVIDERAADLRRGARALCEAHWGTYLLIEDADQASRKMPIWDDPRFVRWEGEGAVSVQLQGGLDVKGLSSDTQVQLPAPDHRKHATLRMRIGSEGRAPIWAEFPIKVHRPIPETARIKCVTMHVRKCGRRDVWSVDFTLELPEPIQIEKGSQGIVGVDLGWRVTGNELRVCAFTSEDGKDIGELRLSAHDLGGFERVETLRATRDQKFNEAKASLVALKLVWPEVLAVRAAHMSQWRSAARLASFIRLWRNHRFAGDEQAYISAESWRYHDEHLWQWEASQRAKSLRSRREKYRIFAADLASKYDTLVLEEFDLRTFAKRPTKEDPIIDKHGRRETQQAERARAYRHLASTSELRMILEQAFHRRGKTSCRVSAVDTTRICASCGVVDREFDAAAEIDWSCKACGAEHDQDHNASDNLCERYRALEKSGSARTRKPAKGEARWAKAKRLRAEKDAAKDTARNAAGNSAE